MLEKIIIKTPFGETISLSVELTDYIRWIKLQIENKIGICALKQCLYFRGKLLSDMKTLEENSILNLFFNR